jgi:hypothetical protein
MLGWTRLCWVVAGCGELVYGLAKPTPATTTTTTTTHQRTTFSTFEGLDFRLGRAGLDSVVLGRSGLW